MATNVTLINCDNKPVSVLADSVGEGILGQVNLLRTDAFVNFGDPSVSYNQIIAESGFLNSGPKDSALDRYGRNDTAQALASLYANLINNKNINLYNRVVSKEGITEPSAVLASITDKSVNRIDLNESFDDLLFTLQNQNALLKSMLDKLLSMLVALCGQSTYNDFSDLVRRLADVAARDLFTNYKISISTTGMNTSEAARVKFESVINALGGNVAVYDSTTNGAIVALINLVLEINALLSNVNSATKLSENRVSNTDSNNLTELYNRMTDIINDLLAKMSALEFLLSQLLSLVANISAVIQALIDTIAEVRNELNAVEANNENVKNYIDFINSELARIDAVNRVQDTRISALESANDPNREYYFEIQYEHLYERIETGVISPTEFAEFAEDYAYVSMLDLINDILNKPAQILQNLNTFVAGNYAGKNSKGLCGALSNPFAGLQGLINSALDIASKIQSVASSIGSILSGGLGGLLDKAKAAFAGALNQIKNLGKFAAEMAKVENMKKLIESTVSNLVESIKSKVANIGKQFDSFVSNVGQFMQNGPIKSIQNMIQTQTNQLRNFFSEENMKGLIDNAKNAVGRFVDQLKNLNETNFVGALGTVLFMACNLMSSIQDFLNKPVNAMKSMFQRVQGEFDKASVFSQQALRESILGGRPYIDPNQRRAETERFRSSIRAGSIARIQNSGNVGAGQGGTYVPDDIVFTYSPQRSSHPEPSSWQHLEFGGQVLSPVRGGEKFWKWTRPVNMRDYGGGSIIPGESGIDEAIGYYGIKLEVLERAEALVEALLEIGAANFGGAPGQIRSGKILITSGFRHQIYNQQLRNEGIGAALNSQHMQGKALDCIMGRGQFREAFIEMARKHGFGGIGRYNSFVHIDIGPARTWNG